MRLIRISFLERRESDQGAAVPVFSVADEEAAVPVFPVTDRRVYGCLDSLIPHIERCLSDRDRELAAEAAATMSGALARIIQTHQQK